MITAEHIVVLADRFREKRAISDSRLSSLLFNDGKRLERLRNGFDVGSRRLPDLIQWFANHWPDGADWPAEVPRPARTATVDAVGTETEAA